MLFNSYEFIFLFLPLCLAVWWHPRLTEFHRLTFLVVASYVFYGWWDYRFVTLLLLSTVVDYQVGKSMHSTTNECRRTLLLLVSLVGNLGLLGFFKYSGFLASSLNAVMAGLSGARPSAGLGDRVAGRDLVLHVPDFELHDRHLPAASGSRP